jgi:hypothetical protein
MEENNEIRQLTLVAFYGEKKLNKNFWEHIEKIQVKLGNYLGNNFQKYEPKQIHGTIVGLEAAKFDASIISKNFLENQHKLVRMELLSILEKILESELLPFEVKIGGFKNEDYIFTSRSMSPFKRSFTIQDKKIVIMGWPFHENKYIPVLDTFRRRLSQDGALHKYHSTPDSYDNDFFFVLGNLKNSLTKNESENLRELIQNEMQTWKDIRIKLTRDDLGIVAYKDIKLENVVPYTLINAIRKINELYGFYPKYENAINNKDWLE